MNDSNSNTQSNVNPRPHFSWLVPVEVMLGSLNHGQVMSCSISSVADTLRDSKEEAYKPKLISIGPLHKGSTRQLQLMEDPKWHYLSAFLNRQGTQQQNRTSEVRMRECGFDLLKLDNVIRASYGGNIQSEPNEMAKIMILDGCFLLELLIRLDRYMERNQTISYNDDPILQNKEKVLFILNDITMLENQIPFIVLKKLYRKVFPDNTEITNDHRVANIVCKAFGYPLMNSSDGVAHILHLMHLSTVDVEQQNQQEEGKQAKVELLRCATRLQAAGIIFLPNQNNPIQNPNQHKLLDVFSFDVSFEMGKLGIPTLYVQETTEVKWRNLIAWEQSRTSTRCKYTSYALFFKGLICCKHDIELLLDKRIIVNETKKSKEELFTLFRTISTGTKHMDSSYSHICKRLNEYKGRRVMKLVREFPIIIWHQCRRMIEIVVYIWLNWYRLLIKEHIPTVWKLVGVVAATVLLVMAALQTYYSSKSTSSN